MAAGDRADTGDRLRNGSLNVTCRSECSEPCRVLDVTGKRRERRPGEDGCGTATSHPRDCGYRQRPHAWRGWQPAASLASPASPLAALPVGRQLVRQASPFRRFVERRQRVWWSLKRGLKRGAETVVERTRHRGTRAKHSSGRRQRAPQRTPNAARPSPFLLILQ